MNMMYEVAWVMYGWRMGLGWLLGVAVIIAVVALVLAMSGGSSPPPRSSAEEILKERFARGEISKEQFEDQLRTLRRNS